jgi:hypothetical protein
MGSQGAGRAEAGGDVPAGVLKAMLSEQATMPERKTGLP